MDKKSVLHTNAPGVFLIKNQKPAQPGNSNFGPYTVWYSGKLSSKADSKDWTVFFDGLLFRDYISAETDAELILNTFIKSGNIEDVTKLKGFYNIIIIHSTGSRGFMLSDALCSRPQYLYQKKNTIASSPTPVTFTEFGLDVSINKMHSLEVFRFLHNGYDRTLANEISRHLPGKYYEFDGNGTLNAVPYIDFSQAVNNDITSDQATEWMYKICKKPMDAVFSHPVLKNMDVHLPLTSGLDSRHLLGQSMESGKTPDHLWHVILKPEDYKPVKRISEKLKIPLKSPSIYELNFKKLLRRWLERSAGLANVHQFYLLYALEKISGRGGIGFNGQLMDKFLGMAPVTTPDDTSKSLINQKWAKSYSGKIIMKGLFKDYASLNQSLYRAHSDHLNSISGENWYKMAIYEFFHKSLHYTGITDTMTSDEYFCFSPGASEESLDFIKSVPFSIGGKKQIRLQALKKYFPEVGSFPDEDGIPLVDKDSRPRTSKPPFQKNLIPFLKWTLGGFKGDPAKNTEHEWLRKSQTLKRIHKKVIFNGLIFKEGFLDGRTAKISWYIHQAGGFQAWTLMSLFTIEMSYRVLYKKQTVDDVINWLFESHATKLHSHYKTE